MLLLIRRIGYRALFLNFDPGAERDPKTRIVLNAGSAQLPDIQVKGVGANPLQYAGTTKYDDFFRRQRLGAGTFLSREDIERRNAFHSVELLQQIPGVRVSVRAARRGGRIDDQVYPLQ